MSARRDDGPVPSAGVAFWLPTSGRELSQKLISRNVRSGREDEKGGVIEAETVIISTGASAKYLGLADEEKYRGLGVSACATCGGFFYRKKNVAVVGGGDTACEEALYLSTLAKKFISLCRGVLRASEVMQRRVKERENIEILFHCNTEGLFGEDGVEGAHLVRHVGTPEEERFDIAIDGFFLGIGHRPNTEIFRGQIELDEEGYIRVKGATTHTNVEGVFAAGDCADPRYRRAVCAMEPDAVRLSTPRSSLWSMKRCDIECGYTHLYIKKSS